MENRCIPIAAPEGAAVYVFGSALHSERAHDLDVLVVYDRTMIPPDNVYQAMEPMFAQLSNAAGLHVHPTMLTKEEEVDCSFIELTGAVALDEFLAVLRD